jgi:tRNA 2-thiouridine synthesizing protein A
MTASTPPDDVLLRLPAEPDEPEVGESLPQRVMRTLVGGRCYDCEKHYSAREAVFSIFLGLKNAPRCLPCVCRRLERPMEELRSDLLAHIRWRDCYLRAWNEAERIDGGNSADAAEAVGPSPSTEVGSTADGEGPPVAAEWNAGGMGCGELVMALRLRMEKLQPGEVIRVTATDPAAPEDLPAWCRLCGHKLVAMNHPDYWIRRKGD